MDKLSFGIVSALVAAVILFSPLKSEPTRGVISVLSPKSNTTKALIIPQKSQPICHFATVETLDGNGEYRTQKVRVCN